MFVNDASMSTEVDGCDSGQIPTSDGHSSTARYRTVQWPHTVHGNLNWRRCKVSSENTRERKIPPICHHDSYDATL